MRNDIPSFSDSENSGNLGAFPSPCITSDEFNCCSSMEMFSISGGFRCRKLNLWSLSSPDHQYDNHMFKTEVKLSFMFLHNLRGCQCWRHPEISVYSQRP
jgi:hypothetical protein